MLADSTDAARPDIIEAIIKAFGEIGASAEALGVERTRLEHDDEYFALWGKVFPDWNDRGVFKGVLTGRRQDSSLGSKN